MSAGTRARRRAASIEEEPSAKRAKLSGESSAEAEAEADADVDSGSESKLRGSKTGVQGGKNGGVKKGGKKGGKKGRGKGKTDDEVDVPSNSVEGKRVLTEEERIPRPIPPQERSVEVFNGANIIHLIATERALPEGHWANNCGPKLTILGDEMFAVFANSSTKKGKAKKPLLASAVSLSRYTREHLRTVEIPVTDPHFVTVVGDRFLVGSFDGHCVHAFTHDWTLVKTYGGGTRDNPGPIWVPYGAAVVAGEVHVANWNRGKWCIIVFDEDTAEQKRVYCSDLKNARITAHEGMLYIADEDRIVVLNPDGSFVRGIGGETPEDKLGGPDCLCIARGRIWAACFHTGRIVAFDLATGKRLAHLTMSRQGAVSVTCSADDDGQFASSSMHYEMGTVAVQPGNCTVDEEFGLLYATAEGSGYAFDISDI